MSVEQNIGVEIDGDKLNTLTLVGYSVLSKPFGTSMLFLSMQTVIDGPASPFAKAPLLRESTPLFLFTIAYFGVPGIIMLITSIASDVEIAKRALDFSARVVGKGITSDINKGFSNGLQN